jgi:SPP1 family phage portal protein
MITRSRGTEINAALVAAVLAEHDLELTRLTELYNYFAGDHDILARERTTGLPNYMLVHGYPNYIAIMTSGYLIGNPVAYSAQVGQEAALDAVLDAYDAADVQSVDSEIALHAAIFGRGCELCYASERAEPMTAAVDPLNAFVVYDNTVAHMPLFGVYRLVSVSGGLTRTESVTAYTADEVIMFSTSNLGVTLTEESRETHAFGNVPMTEYWNNSVETGDFEGVMSLIDAYDLLQSDRVNDKAQFTDSLLVLTGVQGFDAPVAGDTRTAGERLREDKTLALPLEGAKAEWLTKTLNEADTDVLRTAIKSDIHKFSMVPDLTDENFAGNSSGVAMKYKLLGLEQLTKVKERWFREGLRQRLRLFAAFLSVKGAAALDADSVTMTFTRSLPVNDAEIAQTVATLKNIVPDQMLLAQIPYVQDVPAAIDMLKQQRQDSVAEQQAMFGAYPDANREKADDEQDEEQG